MRLVLDIVVISRYIQHGSYPVINPLNETFPANFNLHRTQLFNLNTSTENTTKKHIITEPLPGNWFAAVFIGDYVDDKITQKVSDSCIGSVLV